MKKEEISFSKLNKTKIIIISIVSFVALVALGNWIATSFGTFDSDMAKIFYKGMGISFFRGWTAYTVLDGYITVLSYALPTGLLIFECLWKWFKVNRPNWWVSQHYTGITNTVVGLLTLVYVIFTTVFLASYALFDQGFGVGFDVEFLTGREYIIPIYIVSLLINAVVYGIQVYYYHNKWAKKDNFLESKPWRPALTALLFMLYVYVPNLIMKNGMGRPYWYNVHFTDGLVTDNEIVNEQNGIKGPLERIREIYSGDSIDYYANYMNQSDFNYGWHTATNDLTAPWPIEDQNFKWYEMGNGFFNKNGKYYKFCMKEQAFPSGHMNATALCLIVSSLWFIDKPNNKKTNMWKIIVGSIGAIYFLDMIFALQVSSSHWWSDTMFSIAFAPLGYMASYYTINAIMNRINKNYHTTNW